MKRNISTINMSKRDFKNFTKAQLIKLLLKQSVEIRKVIIKNRKVIIKKCKTTT